jgi:hypothetical protein
VATVLHAPTWIRNQRGSKSFSLCICLWTTEVTYPTTTTNHSGVEPDLERSEFTQRNLNLHILTQTSSI